MSLDVQISSESENIHIFKIFGEWVMFVLAHFNSLDYKTRAGHNVLSAAAHHHASIKTYVHVVQNISVTEE